MIARSVRAEEEYNESTRDGLPFLRVYKQLKEEGYDVIPGMKVAWIVTDARKSPQAVEPWIEGRPFPKDKEPDFAYYAERVAQTLARVTEVFGWDADRLLDAGHQHKLTGSGDDGPTTDGKRRAPPGRRPSTPRSRPSLRPNGAAPRNSCERMAGAKPLGHGSTSLGRPGRSPGVVLSTQGDERPRDGERDAREAQPGWHRAEYRPGKEQGEERDRRHEHRWKHDAGALHGQEIEQRSEEERRDADRDHREPRRDRGRGEAPYPTGEERGQGEENEPGGERRLPAHRARGGRPAGAGHIEEVEGDQTPGPRARGGPPIPRSDGPFPPPRSSGPPPGAYRDPTEEAERADALGPLREEEDEEERGQDDVAEEREE